MTYVREDALSVDHVATALMLLVALAACGKPQEAPPPWKIIDASTLRAMMASGKGLPVFNTMSELECLDHRIPGHAVPGLRGDRKQRLRSAADKERAHRLLL